MRYATSKSRDVDSDPNPFLCVGSREPEQWLAPAATTNGRVQRAAATVALCLLGWLVCEMLGVTHSKDVPVGSATIKGWADVGGKERHRTYVAVDRNGAQISCDTFQGNSSDADVRVLRNTFNGRLTLDICAAYEHRQGILVGLWFWPSAFVIFYGVLIHNINMRRLANWRARQAIRALRGVPPFQTGPAALSSALNDKTH